MWKNYIFSSGICKKGTSSLHREMEKGLLCKIAWGEANLAITIFGGKSREKTSSSLMVHRKAIHGKQVRGEYFMTLMEQRS
jgi:hypothetical protein